MGFETTADHIKTICSYIGIGVEVIWELFLKYIVNTGCRASCCVTHEGLDVISGHFELNCHLVIIFRLNLK